MPKPPPAPPIAPSGAALIGNVLAEGAPIVLALVEHAPIELDLVEVGSPRLLTG